MTPPRFPLAPMSTGIRWLTYAVMVLPAGLLVAGLAAPEAAFALVPVGAVVALLFLAIYLAWRPSAFEVEPGGLRIDFPIRSRLIAGSELRGAEPIPPDAVRERLGFVVRVGVGGLWGGFGWLWSRRAGWVEFYISRLDGMVWVERRQGRPLLITPEHPERFAETLGGTV